MRAISLRMAFASDFVPAYRAANYVVAAEPEVVLRIGEANPRLDALLDRTGARCAAFLTAYNPYSERRSSEDDNRAAATELERALVNYSRYPAEGRDPTGRWPPERGVLVLGVPRAAAEALGRRFKQNAIVFIEHGSPPELVLLERTRLVLDTNAWLDWLLFADPGLAPIRAAVANGHARVFINEACFAELKDVLTRSFGRHTLDTAAQIAALAECARNASLISDSSSVALPTCRDPDDQKFLALAAAAHADALITKDTALLELARHRMKPSFRIVTPQQFATDLHQR